MQSSAWNRSEAVETAPGGRSAGRPPPWTCPPSAAADGPPQAPQARPEFAAEAAPTENITPGRRGFSPDRLADGVGRGEASPPEMVDEGKPWPAETFAPQRISRGMLRPYGNIHLRGRVSRPRRRRASRRLPRRDPSSPLKRLLPKTPPPVGGASAPTRAPTCSLTVVGRGEASPPEMVDEGKPWPAETFAPQRISRGMLRPYGGIHPRGHLPVRAGGRPAERKGWAEAVPSPTRDGRRHSPAPGARVLGQALTGPALCRGGAQRPAGAPDHPPRRGSRRWSGRTCRR